MKYRLIAGTINRYADDDEWENLHLDASDRGIWHGDLHVAVSPEWVGNITDLSFLRPAMFDEARLHHVLEHLTWGEGALALAEIFKVLKPGGVLDIEVPDLDRVCRAWADGDYPKADLQQWIYGEQLPNHETWDSHRYGYCEDTLREQLEAAGFTVGDREETGLAVRFLARKPVPSE